MRLNSSVQDLIVRKLDVRKSDVRKVTSTFLTNLPEIVKGLE